MDQLIEFAKLNWYLFAAFFIILFLLASSVIQRKTSGVVSISNQALLRLSNDDEAIIIDVRDTTAYRKGHISTSINIPLSELTTKASNIIEKYKDKSLICVCQTGIRSFQAAKILKKQTTGTVYNLHGGIDNWKQDNLPLSKHK